MSKDESGFIYVIEDEPNICKIGFSKSFPSLRHKQITCSYHKDFKLVGFFKSDTAFRDEKTIHKLLKEYRLKGEWFSLSFKEIKNKLNYFFSEDIEIEEKLYNENEKEWMNMNLRIRNDILKILDEEVKKRIGMNRTAWILEAIQEKFKRDDL